MIQYLAGCVRKRTLWLGLWCLVFLAAKSVSAAAFPVAFSLIAFAAAVAGTVDFVRFVYVFLSAVFVCITGFGWKEGQLPKRKMRHTEFDSDLDSKRITEDSVFVYWHLPLYGYYVREVVYDDTRS